MRRRVHLLHALAWSALRTMPPRRAKRVVDVAARFVVRSPLDEEHAQRIAATLDGHGTCLSRAVTLAACVGDADVVLGAERSRPRVPGDWTAHAWVETRGRALRPSDVSGIAIARFR